MAWTAPLTWTTDQIVSATEMNTYISDNLNYLLGGRPGQAIAWDNGTNYSTTSTSFVDIDSTNLAISLTLIGTKAYVSFTGVVAAGSAATLLDILVNSTRIGEAGTEGLARVAASANSTISIGVLVTGLTPGVNTFKIQWRVASGTAATLYSGVAGGAFDHIPVFSAFEVG